MPSLQLGAQLLQGRRSREHGIFKARVLSAAHVPVVEDGLQRGREDRRWFRRRCRQRRQLGDEDHLIGEKHTGWGGYVLSPRRYCRDANQRQTRDDDFRGQEWATYPG